MNRTVFSALMLAIAACAGVFAPGTALSAENVWGTKVVAGTSPIRVDIVCRVAWSPDGQSLLFAAREDKRPGMNYTIQSVPAGGGVLKEIFLNTFPFPYKDTQIQLSTHIIPIDFSLDGKYLFTQRNLIGPEQWPDIKVEISEKSYSFQILSSNPVIDRLEPVTGAFTRFGTDISTAALSRSGRYLAYTQYYTGAYEDFDPNAYSEVIIRDLEKDTQWSFSMPAPGIGCFTPDDKYLIFSDGPTNESISRMGQIFRIPVAGGRPEQITAFKESGFMESILVCDCSPSGEWVLFRNLKDIGKQEVTLRMLNLKTLQTFTIFPVVPGIKEFYGRFSPDGTKIAYIRQDTAVSGYGIELFVRDFDPAGLKSDSQTAVAEESPSPFTLASNFPNPFNPATTISYKLAAPGKVSLAVYDITGRKVRDLAGGFMSAGAHSAFWNGSDDIGAAVASGVYFARLESGGKTITRRMMLVK